MASEKDTLLEINNLHQTSTLTQTYEEIAAARITRIRSSVVQTRSFITELTAIYHELLASHREEVARLLKKKKNDKVTMMMDRNGKTLCLLLSANTGLFGDIINKTFAMFDTEIAKGSVDIAIVGKIGATTFQGTHPNTQFSYFEYPDNGTDPKALGEITSLLVQYSRVYVFHGQFQTIVSQMPVIANLYGMEEAVTEVKGTTAKYLFEPSLEKILQFFEAEIFASIFEQTIHESQLAKNGSRMLLLDNASQNIKDSLKKTELHLRILKHRETNTKQLNALTGMSMWGK